MSSIAKSGAALVENLHGALDGRSHIDAFAPDVRQHVFDQHADQASSSTTSTRKSVSHLQRRSHHFHEVSVCKVFSGDVGSARRRFSARAAAAFWARRRRFDPPAAGRPNAGESGPRKLFQLQSGRDGLPTVRRRRATLGRPAGVPPGAVCERLNERAEIRGKRPRPRPWRNPRQGAASARDHGSLRLPQCRRAARGARPHFAIRRSRRAKRYRLLCVRSHPFQRGRPAQRLGVV